MTPESLIVPDAAKAFNTDITTILTSPNTNKWKTSYDSLIYHLDSRLEVHVAIAAYQPPDTKPHEWYDDKPFYQTIITEMIFPGDLWSLQIFSISEKDKPC